MALSQIKGQEGLYVGGLWALRRCDQLEQRHITHVLSMVAFDASRLTNMRNEAWAEYGARFKHVTIDLDDVDDADLLAELPRAVAFIHEGLASGAVFVHCAAGKSRSVSVVVGYLLWAKPGQFDPNTALAAGTQKRSPRETAGQAVDAALELVRLTRPMAEPNDGFMQQLALWWEMGCPDNVKSHGAYQRWAYNREVAEHVAIGQAPARLRFEDEEEGRNALPSALDATVARCKKCRKTLATAPFIQPHGPSATCSSSPCPHLFVEPLSWMRAELEKGQLKGRLACPNQRCGAAVGRYDWKGIRCACGAWITPGLSLQRAKVDVSNSNASTRPDGLGPSQDDEATRMKMMGIRLPPGAGRGQHL
ncbi:hypothetical protein CDD81_1320 [Ophiocordyceps australis]|uniref:protein-tyrosine-phosphatase n=1 Tax=Ophiocordyceps australis TaxID=1399860 RepID=A0A2C5Y0G0_9HYPO|nr:hypothetical protein CDD81_1320 [Ophiocordyceps australis]